MIFQKPKRKFVFGYGYDLSNEHAVPFEKYLFSSFGGFYQLRKSGFGVKHIGFDHNAILARMVSQVKGGTDRNGLRIEVRAKLKNITMFLCRFSFFGRIRALTNCGKDTMESSTEIPNAISNSSQRRT